MKKTTLFAALSATLILSACSNLHDVNTSWCDPVKQPEPVVVQEPQVEQINLAADALFKFDKSSQRDLLVKGQETLDELAHKLNTGYAQVVRIDLTGHTDRLGNEQYNYNLGLSRAQTVKAYLESKGVNAPITVRSAGESQPVTTNCVGNKATPALTECLQPDRRVVVEIVGLKKGNQ